MRLPRTIKVGANTIEIKLVNGKEIQDDAGEFHAGTQEMKINKKLAKNQKALTVIHETLHALIYDAGMAGTKMTEEQVVTTLEGRIGALIRDNPKLVQYLQENLK